MNAFFLTCVIMGVYSVYSANIDRLSGWNWNPRISDLTSLQIDRELLIECLKFGEQIKELKPKMNGLKNVKSLINSGILNIYFFRKSLSKCAPFLKKLKHEEEEKKMEHLKKIKEEKENQIYRKFLADRTKSTILKDFLTMRY